MVKENMTSSTIGFLEFQKVPQVIQLPIIQRDADSWGNVELKKMIEDLVIHYESDEDFDLQSIYCTEKKTGDLDIRRLYDGQQRETNYTLLTCAIMKYLHEFPEAIPYITTGKLEKYLINQGESGDDKYKLHLFDDEFETLKMIIDNAIENKEIPYSNKGLLHNYNYLKKSLNSNNIQKVWNGLKQTRFQVCVLGSRNNPYRIFRNINRESSGVRLSLSDELFGIIFERIYVDEEEARLDNEEEARLIKKNYWKPIVNLFGTEKRGKTPLFDYAIQMFVSVHQKRHRISHNKIEEYFEELLNKYDDIYVFLEELKEYCEIYTNIWFGLLDNDELNEKHSILLLFKESVMCALTEFNLQYTKNNISWEEYLSLLDILRNHCIRFKTDSKGEVKNQLTTTLTNTENEQFYGMFVYELTERYGLTDEEVRNNLNLLPYYEKFDSKLITFIELELNNYGSKEKVSSENSTKEHVLPQTMTANWRIHLGTDKADKIHRLYLHNIGNICLTGYNSELGNDTFKSKKVLYEDSVFPLTRKLAEYEVWNEESICNYRDYKIDLFLKIFSVPDISQMKFGLKTSDKITSSDEAYAK